MPGLFKKTDMIKIKLEDDFGNDLQLNDVVVVHYPNECIKFFGVLVFEKNESQFLVSDMTEGYETIRPASYKKIERLGTYEKSPGIFKELGRVEVENITEFDKIFKLCGGL